MNATIDPTTQVFRRGRTSEVIVCSKIPMLAKTPIVAPTMMKINPMIAYQYVMALVFISTQYNIMY